VTIGNPAAYEALMGKLPHGHFDVVIPVEGNPDAPDQDIKRARKLIHTLAKQSGCRYSVTHDQVKHPNAWVIRVLGTQEKIDALREALRTTPLP
jgi:hypothetical protein